MGRMSNFKKRFVAAGGRTQFKLKVTITVQAAVVNQLGGGGGGDTHDVSNPTTGVACRNVAAIRSLRSMTLALET